MDYTILGYLVGTIIYLALFIVWLIESIKFYKKKYPPNKIKVFQIGQFLYIGGFLFLAAIPDLLGPGYIADPYSHGGYPDVVPNISGALERPYEILCVVALVAMLVGVRYVAAAHKDGKTY